MSKPASLHLPTGEGMTLAEGKKAKGSTLYRILGGKNLENYDKVLRDFRNPERRQTPKQRQDSGCHALACDRGEWSPRPAGARRISCSEMPPREFTVEEINAMPDDFPGLKQRLLRAALERENAAR